MTKLLQWNLNGLEGQYEYLQKLIVEKSIEVVCLQETNLKGNKSINMKNFTCYNKNRSDCLIASGGVAILVKSNLYAKEIKLQSNIEAIAVTLTTNNNKQITICNIYLSNRYKISLETLENLLKELPKPVVLLGDFNSHSTLWGSYKNDKRGKIVEEFICKHDIVLLNDQPPTHFNASTGRSSAIDLSPSAVITSLQ